MKKLQDFAAVFQVVAAVDHLADGGGPGVLSARQRLAITEHVRLPVRHIPDGPVCLPVRQPLQCGPGCGEIY